MLNEILNVLMPELSALHLELFTACIDLEATNARDSGLQPPSTPAAKRYRNAATGKRFTSDERNRLRRLATAGWTLKDSKDASGFLTNFNSTVLQKRNKRVDLGANAADFPKHVKVAPNMQTWDFSALYTNLPQAEIVAKFNERLQQLQTKWEKIGGPAGVQVKLDLDGPVTYTVKLTDQKRLGVNTATELSIGWDEVKDLFALVLRSCVCQFNGSIFHQVNGIPMGLEPAVHIANGILAAYEYDFIKQLIGGEGDETEWHLLLQFRHAKRYIDDLLLIGAKDFEHMRYAEQSFVSPETGRQLTGIYPHGVPLGNEKGNESDVVLTINLEHRNRATNNSDQTVIFLDMAVDWDHSRGSFVWSTFDKRRKTKHDLAPMTRLMPASACMWPTAKEGVVTSELSRALYTCSTMPRFIAQAARTLYEIYRKGYDWSAIKQKTKAFLSSQPLYVGPELQGWTGEVEHTWKVIAAAVGMIWTNGMAELDHRHDRLGFTPASVQRIPPPMDRSLIPDSVRYHLT